MAATARHLAALLTWQGRRKPPGRRRPEEDDANEWRSALVSRPRRAQLSGAARHACRDRRSDPVGSDRPSALPGARFVYVIIRYDRRVHSLQKIFAAFEPLGNLSEDECRRAWFEADQLVDAKIERLEQ